jgi:phage terminase small subunit
VAIETSLTVKQRNFCHAYIENGGDGMEAYLTAYDSTSKTSAKVEACRLLQRDDITAYLQALTKPMRNKAINNAINEREKKRSWLWDMIENPNTGDSDRLRAMDILNKMDSEYININRNEEVQTDISKLDTAMLSKLASNGSN